jgi:16S rRNA (uracil1498-N3)-methyltransferase
MTLEQALLETAELPLKLVFDREGCSVRDVMQGSAAKSGVAALIGPEGGLSDAELLAAVAQGFQRVSLGPFTLRTETAAVAALAVIAELKRTGLGQA